MLRNPSCPCPALPIEIGQKPELSVHDPGAGESNGCRVLKAGGGCSRGRGNWGTLRIPSEDWGTLGKMKGITTLPLRILLSCAKKHRLSKRPMFYQTYVCLMSFFLVKISTMMFNNFPSQFFNDEFLCAFFFQV